MQAGRFSAWRKRHPEIQPGKGCLRNLSYQGNIDVLSARERAKIITSPNNRIGQVTRALLFVNLIYCAKALKALEPALEISSPLP